MLGARGCLLQAIDRGWREHLSLLDHLRHSIGLRAYGQRDPLREYQNEAFNHYKIMLEMVRMNSLRLIFHVEMANIQPLAPRPAPKMVVIPAPDMKQAMIFNAPAADKATHWNKAPRNSPCPCNSGKKFKHCHGLVE